MIVSVQAGFIGPWGEGHSSTDVADPSPDGGSDVLEALPDAVPDRVVQLRTPLQKRTIYG